MSIVVGGEEIRAQLPRRSYGTISENDSEESLKESVSLRARTIIAVTVASTASIVFGFGISFSSPVLVGLIRDFGIDNSTQALFASMAPLFCMIGSLTSALTLDRCGRIRALQIATLIGLVGYALMAIGFDMAIVLVGRILTGYANGVFASGVITYVTEISPVAYRGNLTSISQLFLSFGIFLPYAIGASLSPENWRPIAWIGAGLAACVGLGLHFLCPESPVWLVTVNREWDANNNEIWLGMEGMIDYGPISNQQHTVGYWTAFRDRRLWKVITLAIVIPAMVQATGNAPIASYLSLISEQAGIQRPEIANMVMGAVQVVGGGVGVVLLDRLGRKVFIVVACAFCTVALSGLSYVFLAGGTSADPERISSSGSFVAVLAVCMYMFFFSAGMGLVPLVVISEISPTRARGVAMSLGAGSSWASAFLVTMVYPLLAEQVDPGLCFILFGLDAVLLIGLVLAFVPETKGRSAAEIEELMTGRPVTEDSEASNWGHATEKSLPVVDVEQQPNTYPHSPTKGPLVCASISELRSNQEHGEGTWVRNSLDPCVPCPNQPRAAAHRVE
eukprot:Clim_evm16s50 gene=Clim_evmTU16s50